MTELGWHSGDAGWEMGPTEELPVEGFERHAEHLLSVEIVSL